MHPQPWRMTNVLRVALTSLAFTLATWPWFEWKGIVSFVPFWGIFEFAYRTRVRASLACPYCGFDPFLYMIDVKKARLEIETYWRKKFEEKGLAYPGDPEPDSEAAELDPRASSDDSTHGITPAAVKSKPSTKRGT